MEKTIEKPPMEECKDSIPLQDPARTICSILLVLGVKRLDHTDPLVWSTPPWSSGMLIRVPGEHSVSPAFDPTRVGW